MDKKKKKNNAKKASMDTTSKTAHMILNPLPNISSNLSTASTASTVSTVSPSSLATSDQIIYPNIDIEFNTIKNENKELNNKIKKLEEDLNNIKVNFKKDYDNNNSKILMVINAFTSLEKHIFYEITGTIKKRVNIRAFFENPVNRLLCDMYLRKYDITNEHIYIISDLIQKGCNISYLDKSEHVNIKRSEWTNIATSILNDQINCSDSISSFGSESDLEDIKMIDDLLNILEKYVPVNEDDTWIITGP
jgi:hypothetical protein